MQRTQFGQRGVTINGQPVDPAASTPRAMPRTSAAGTDERSNPLVIVGIVFLAFVFLAWLEALLSGTALITPISQTLLWSLRGIGLVVGLTVTVLTVLTMTDVSLIRRGLTLLVCPLLIAFAFGEIAYRISDWAEFGFSSQQFEPAQYPIASISHGRRGARSTIEIDPFDTGDNTEIPVNYDQYRVLLKTSADSCVTVMQRKSASGAIEIQTNGRYMLNTPDEITVVRCGFNGAEATPVSAGSANPWRKD